MKKRMSRSTIAAAVLLTIAGGPAWADLGRSVTISICNNKVHGHCKVTKDADDAFDRVLFRCEVSSPDHSPNLMGSANIEAKMLPNVKSSVALPEPKVGPVHVWHQYCRKITGVPPHKKIKFFPTPLFYSATLKDASKCILRGGPGQIH